MKKISIIIPAYNEEKTISEILFKVCNAKLIDGITKEIIVINDCSTDKTEMMVQKFLKGNTSCEFKYLKHSVNKGKGAAVRTGIKEAKGDYLIIQDADLEYDPDEYNILLKSVVDGVADVVYGSRFTGERAHRILFFWHDVGNRFLTFLSNIFTNFNLTDIECCYKLFKAEIIQGITLKEDRFGFDPEITAKISHIPNIRIYEVGISYYGRTYREGKKINWKDGFKVMYCILKYNLFR